MFYTIPYISGYFRVWRFLGRYSCRSIDESDKSINVKCLSLHHTVVTQNSQFYFPNVKSLTLENCDDSKYDVNCLLKLEDVIVLKGMVNFYNIETLNIFGYCRIDSSSILLQILKEAPKLSEIAVDQCILHTIYADWELCEYLTKMIKKISLTNRHDFAFNNDEIIQFSKIFSNIEHARFYPIEPHHLLILLNHSSKLSDVIISINSRNDIYGKYEVFLKDNALVLNKMFHTVLIKTDVSCIYGHCYVCFDNT